MNQTTNLIQWKNLTQRQQDEFDFENYKYEYQSWKGKTIQPVAVLFEE